MNDFSQTHLSDDDLRDKLEATIRENNASKALQFIHLAEIDRRRLYTGFEFSSMFAYCVEKLDMEADEACEALLVAAVARRFPEIYEAIAEGDVDATSVCMIAPHISRTR